MVGTSYGSWKLPFRPSILAFLAATFLTVNGQATVDLTQFPPPGTFNPYGSCNAGICLPGPWPTQDRVPTPVTAWVQAVNLSLVPNIPPRGPPSTNYGVVCGAGDSTNATMGPSGYCDYTCALACTRDEIKTCPQGVWGLTYDDGPSNYTTLILDRLKSLNLKATFFVIGSRVLQRPDILLRTYQEGHEICLHTWSHASPTTLTNEQFITEIYWVAKAVYQTIGVIPTCHRNPYGDADDRTRAVIRAMGLRNVLWNHDTSDWMSSGNPYFDPNWITNNFTIWIAAAGQNGANSPTGFISLEHDLFPIAAQQAPAAITMVNNDGFLVQPVGVCQGWNNFYQNTTYQQGAGLNPVLLGLVPAASTGPAPSAAAASAAPAPTSSPTQNTALSQGGTTGAGWSLAVGKTYA
ncbi:hypothetical protein SmJEL517_g00531 [Synchytrium microbalum]|uniref:NodB homology domain-containing protein n=1 Tax=Synchytrium microbalum TaxID=1806994 RepID=A0A507CHV4_9FUNG|nr:uncharacterized protein SmJEL517_g00531 [Synchytrium microbalum]TPX37706.1 hypothetical protein SmJEL517_g00531 [Synchytrium microbalum]